MTNSLANETLRDSINIFFAQRLPPRPNKPDIERAIELTVNEYPELLDYYIRKKEGEKDKAVALSTEKVAKLREELLETLTEFCKHIFNNSDFYEIKLV